MEDTYAHYLKKEVIRYIKEEMDKGHPLYGIRRSLLEGGHHQDLVQEAIETLKRKNFDVNAAMREKVKSKALAQELYGKIISSLVRYIQYQMEHGYDVEEVRSVLISHGHHKEIIEEAMKAITIPDKETVDYHNFVFVGSIIVFLLGSFYLSFLIDESIGLVMIGLFPAFATLIIIGVMINKVNEGIKNLLWFLPFVFGGIFFILGNSGSFPIISGMEFENLSVFNIVLGMVLATIFIAPVSKPTQPEPMGDIVRKENLEDQVSVKEVKEQKLAKKPKKSVAERERTRQLEEIEKKFIDGYDDAFEPLPTRENGRFRPEMGP